MAMEPSPPSPGARALHPLTGTPPRRNGTNKALPLSPLNRRLSAARSTTAVSTGVLGSPVPPSSPRCGGSSPKQPLSVQNANETEQRDLEEIKRLEQRLKDLDVHEHSMRGAAGLMALPGEVLERIVLAAERSLPQLSATCRRLRALVTSAEFDAVWLGQCAALLGNNSKNFRALHGCGAARSGGRSDEPVWRMIAIELRTGRLGGGGQTFAVHPAALWFSEPLEEAQYFSLISRITVDSPISSDGAEMWHQWKHAPLRWQTDEQHEALIEEFWAPDQSIKLELVVGTASGQQQPQEIGEAEPSHKGVPLDTSSNTPGMASATRSWCIPREVCETRVLYRAKFAASQDSSNGGTEADQWEMSISYTPSTSLYVLHYLRSSTKPVAEEEPAQQMNRGAEDDQFQFAEDRLLIQLGSWYEIPLNKRAAGGEEADERRRMYDMYGQQDPGAELALYLQDAETFCTTAMHRYTQLRDGAMRAVAASAGASGQELQQARDQVEAIEDWVTTRIEVLRLHGSEFYAALRRGWCVLQSTA